MKTWPRKLWFVFLGLLLLAETQINVSAQPKMQTIVVTVAQNGGSIVIAVGDQLEVRLPAQLGTGFSWAPVPSEIAPLQLVEQRVKTQAGAAPGSPEVQVFTFTAKDEGTTELRFEYRRPWVPQKARARSFSINVTVH